MAKQGSIKHYRQTGAAKAPPSLPFGELAVAKDGTLFVGNENNVPVQAGSGMELLWVNAKPGNDFIGQKIAVDFREYEFVYITLSYGSAVEYIPQKVSHVLKKGTKFRCIGYSSTYGSPGSREISFTDTEISIGNAFYEGPVRNDLTIPIEIYGIKGW